jgi:uncharacterized membrane protein
MFSRHLDVRISCDLPFFIIGIQLIDTTKEKKMSMDMQIIVANFDSKDGAKDALKAAKHEKVNRGDVAILSKNEKGKIRVKETDDWGCGKGAVAGAVVGSFIPIVGTLAGAVIGGVTAKLRDGGFPNDTLKDMAESLEPDHSMFVMLTDSGSVEAVEGVLEGAGGQLISHPVSADLAALLDEAAQAGEAQVEVSPSDEEDQA